jgi:hypothetical protein
MTEICFLEVSQSSWCYNEDWLTSEDQNKDTSEHFAPYRFIAPRRGAVAASEKRVA